MLVGDEIRVRYREMRELTPCDTRRAAWSAWEGGCWPGWPPARRRSSSADVPWCPCASSCIPITSPCVPTISPGVPTHHFSLPGPWVRLEATNVQLRGLSVGARAEACCRDAGSQTHRQKLPSSSIYRSHSWQARLMWPDSEKLTCRTQRGFCSCL